MSLKEYHRLADLFSKLNSQENIEDDLLLCLMLRS